MFMNLEYPQDDADFVQALDVKAHPHGARTRPLSQASR